MSQGLPKGAPPHFTLGPAVVVLAAGASTRMGEPKARLRWGTRSFLAACVDAAYALTNCPALAATPRLLVVGGAVDLRTDCEALEVGYVHNFGWQDGPLSSLQCALGSLGPGPVAVLTVDRPHLRLTTLHSLRDAVIAEPTQIWQPRFAGMRGHPIVWPASLRAELLGLERRGSPRSLLARPEVAALRRSIEVEDPAVLDNLDRPEDLARLGPPPAAAKR